MTVPLLSISQNLKFIYTNLVNSDENFDDSGDCGELHGCVYPKRTSLEQMQLTKMLYFKSGKLKFPSNFLGSVL